MSRTLRYSVEEAEGGVRLDAFCAEHGFYPSRSNAVRAIEAGLVEVNGLTAAKKHIVQDGDVIVYRQEDEKVSEILKAQPIDLDIRFEDDELIVLSKQVGLVCHPTPDVRENTLVNALLWHCGADRLCNVQGEDDRLGIVHRLDRDTSGLMLAAKTDRAGAKLMADIKARTVDRHYLALVHGIIAADTGMIDAPIARSPQDRKKMAVRQCPSSREAITTFTVLERFSGDGNRDGFTLIDCKLFTGRTHQIRVHMQYAKHPLVGDPLYKAHAPKDESLQLGLARQFLHSYRLALDHPVSGERLSFADNPPLDLAYALEDLAPYSQGKTEEGAAIAELLAASPHPSVEGYVYNGDPYE